MSPETHVEFFEAIRNRHRQARPWRDVAAGLVALRTADAWIAGDDISQPVASLAGMLQGIQENPTRNSLVALTEALTNGASKAQIARNLMTYARSLEDDAQWTLAIDVYSSALKNNIAIRARLRVACYLRLGQCYRQLNALVLCRAAFRRAERVAKRHDYRSGELMARIGLARVDMLRGNVRRARARLMDVLKRANNRHRSVRSKALHDLSDYHFNFGNARRGIFCAFAALKLCRDSRERDRLLGDLGNGFMEIGRLEPARTSFLIQATAREQVVRWVALCNLLEVSSRALQRSDFERYALALSNERLSPLLATMFQISLGRGRSRLGDRAIARDHFRLAVSLAAEHGLNHLLIEAERSLMTGFSEPLARAVNPDWEGLEHIEVALEQMGREARI